MVEAEKLFAEGITPNGFYVLCCIFDKKPVSPFINLNVEILLLGTEWITNAIESRGFENLQLSSRAIELITSLRKASFKLTDEMIAEYRNIFPNETIPSSGKKARSTPKEIRDQFDRFYKFYDYPWETILEATRQYVDEYEKKRPAYNFMRTAGWFIVKQDAGKSLVSDLASYCDSIMDSPKNPGKMLHDDVY